MAANRATMRGGGNRGDEAPRHNRARTLNRQRLDAIRNIEAIAVDLFFRHDASVPSLLM